MCINCGGFPPVVDEEVCESCHEELMAAPDLDDLIYDQDEDQ